MNEYPKKVVLDNLVDSETKENVEVEIADREQEIGFLRAGKKGKDFGERFALAASGLPSMTLSDEFGDPETLLNSRAWLKQALEGNGAKVVGGGIGCGAADLDIELEGMKYFVSIKPML